MVSQCSFERAIKYSGVKDALSRSYFAFLVLVLNRETGGGKERKRGRNGKVMSDGCFVCVCHSQLLNFAF